jgi:hypothetical protein
MPLIVKNFSVSSGTDGRLLSKCVSGSLYYIFSSIYQPNKISLEQRQIDKRRILYMRKVVRAKPQGKQRLLLLTGIFPDAKFQTKKPESVPVEHWVRDLSTTQ